MATRVSGQTGDVSIDGGALENVRNWSADVEIDNDAHAHSDLVDLFQLHGRPLTR